MKYALFTSMAAALVMLSSCSAETDELTRQDKVQTTISVGLNAQTRAAQALSTEKYDAKMYLYEATGATDGYSFKTEIPLTGSELTVDGLTGGNLYKAVFLAVPKGQTPELPATDMNDTTHGYDQATATYINGKETDTENDIFRSILSFKASTATSSQNTVLTRQNGALEVRIKNHTGMTKVALHANGHVSMFVNDGTGGQVITSGDPVALSKTITEGLTASEVRIRINLLPQEDITDKDGSDNYLEITTAAGTTKYPIKSDQPTIPIYPNQITWLTLGNGTGNFDVSFSGKINLDDDEWDGWN